MDFECSKQENNEENKLVASPSRVQNLVLGPDKDGIKTITEYHTDENGIGVRTVRKVRETTVTTRVNKSVVARKQWKKFGKCVGLPPGLEPNVTYVSPENINLQLKLNKHEDETPNDDDSLTGLEKLKSKKSIVLCKHCAGSHWSLKCPKLAEICGTQEQPGAKSKPPYEEPSSLELLATNVQSRGKYVPIHLRTKPTGPDESANQIRVSNIPDGTTENDLRDLFRPFGNTSRIYIAIDRSTNQSRGFAFITFTNRQDAQKAINRLNGYGYGNLILRVEWAKPRQEMEKD